MILAVEARYLVATKTVFVPELATGLTTELAEVEFVVARLKADLQIQHEAPVSTEPAVFFDALKTLADFAAVEAMLVAVFYQHPIGIAFDDQVKDAYHSEERREMMTKAMTKTVDLGSVRLDRVVVETESLAKSRGDFAARHWQRVLTARQT